ncbi:hypothetical protein [Vibrio sp. JPW-9-11-11]|nr:hypothetical protein [Vibrio sp. JPW-9-11-11]
MKRFFPSSVMLTPFVVKHYHQDFSDDEQPESERPQDEQEESEE